MMVKFAVNGISNETALCEHICRNSTCDAGT
jgi:hypothetical protein